MDIQLNRVRLSERGILHRLLQYSLYEESAWDGNEIGDDALFACPRFDAYFTDPDWEAFLFREPERKKLLGFAMITPCLQTAASGHCIAEFMVLPQYRRKGIGRAAALACFETHPGRWEVSPSCGSQNAYRFWKQVICAYTGGALRFENGSFVFSTNPPPDHQNADTASQIFSE